MSLEDAEKICKAVDLDGEGKMIDYRDFTMGSIDTSYKSILDYCKSAYELFYLNNNGVETILSTEFIDALCKNKQLNQELL